MTHEAPSSTGNAVRPPDGGWGWVVVFASFMINVIGGGFACTLGIFLVEFKTHFGEGSEATSWISSILAGVTLGSGPIVSCLVNKYGCRPITIAGAVLASFGLAISTFATNSVTLYMTIGVVAGFGFGLIYLPAIVSVTCYFELKRSFATGIAVCGSGLGTLIFAPLVEYLITEYFWKGALLILSGITLNCIVFGALLRPLEPSKQDSSVDEEANETNPENLTPGMSQFVEEQEPNTSRVTACGCIPLEKKWHDAFREMMDFSLIKDPVFIIFTISNFFTSIGFNVPYVYIKDKALDLNIASQDASFLLAVIGIANTVSRIVLGYISDKPWLNRLWLYNSALTICGIATGLSAFCFNYTTLVIYCAVFGATSATYVGLNSVIVVDLLGLDKLTNAFGILLLFQGVASLVGPPIAGRLKDTLGSYDPGFYLAGSMIAISGLMLFFIPCIQHLQRKRTSLRTVAH